MIFLELQGKQPQSVCTTTGQVQRFWDHNSRTPPLSQTYRSRQAHTALRSLEFAKASKTQLLHHKRAAGRRGLTKHGLQVGQRHWSQGRRRGGSEGRPAGGGSGRTRGCFCSNPVLGRKEGRKLWIGVLNGAVTQLWTWQLALGSEAKYAAACGLALRSGLPLYEASAARILSSLDPNPDGVWGRGYHWISVGPAWPFCRGYKTSPQRTSGIYGSCWADTPQLSPRLLSLLTVAEIEAPERRSATEEIRAPFYRWIGQSNSHLHICDVINLLLIFLQSKHLTSIFYATMDRPIPTRAH